MSPHAVRPDVSDADPQGQPETKARQADYNGNKKSCPGRSLLQRFNDDEVHDMICVGFGPASLAIAIALQDAIEIGDPLLHSRAPKVRFLERQPRFAWHAGMLLPGTKMQITFTKDLATLRNPRSEFTFLNYLHRKNRLVSFTNLGTFLPQRIEYEDYMHWCADHFADVVDYDQDVEAVNVGRTDPQTGTVECFEVVSQDRRAGKTIIRRARHVVVAVGGKPNMPQCIDANHPRVLHSSQYATGVGHIFPPGTQPKSVAVVGAGQSAAEVFHNIPSRFPGAKSYLLIKGAALRPSDDSPFVNEIFDPQRVDEMYYRSPQARADAIELDKGTNYGVVRLELLEEIYAALYSYRIRYESESEWPQQILIHRTVAGMKDCVRESGRGIRLQIANASQISHTCIGSKPETLDVDLVIVASGYRRNAHEEMLRGLEHLAPGCNGNASRWTVGRDYGIEFEKDTVVADAGIWLQGCNESTHGLSDTLLSVLATRGGEMIQSIFGDRGGIQANLQ